MVSVIHKALEKDAADYYNRYAKMVFIPFLAIYFVVFFISHHTVVKDIASESVLTKKIGGERDELSIHHAGDKGILVAVAKDGLKMVVKEDVPSYYIYLHSFAAMSLVLICLFQKENVKYMITEYKAWLPIHKAVGILGLISVFLMNLGGFLIAPYSSFQSFTIFIYFFAAPFSFFAVGLYVTAKASLIEYHRLFGNMMLKGCIGTPLARACGSLLQVLGWDYTLGYYQGIGFVTVVLGLWQVIELIQFFTHSESKTSAKQQ